MHPEHGVPDRHSTMFFHSPHGLSDAAQVFVQPGAPDGLDERASVLATENEALVQTKKGGPQGRAFLLAPRARGAIPISRLTGGLRCAPTLRLLSGNPDRVARKGPA
jgi:hypothetical protein